MKLFFKEFKRGMGDWGSNISTIVNSILLAIVYVVGIGVSACFAKISRKRFLETELSGETYWSELNLKKKNIDEYYRQF